MTLLTRYHPPMLIIDTHTHFYDPARPQGVPWPPKGNAGLYRTVLPEHYKAVAQPQGVTGTVVVEASSWLEDNQWVLDLARHDSFLMGVVGHLDPLDQAFDRHLARFAREPKFRGIRINGALLAGPEGDRVRATLSRLSAADLALDVLAQPEHLSAVGALAAQVPDLRIIVNHVGGPHIDGRQPDPHWRQAMQALARGPRVYCKVSGLPEQTGQRPAPLEAAYYRPVLDVLWDAFGEDRLLYGSNWPVCEPFADYAAVQHLAGEYLSQHGKTARAKVWGLNARRAYGLYDAA